MNESGKLSTRDMKYAYDFCSAFQRDSVDPLEAAEIMHRIALDLAFSYGQDPVRP